MDSILLQGYLQRCALEGIQDILQGQVHVEFTGIYRVANKYPEDS